VKLKPIENQVVVVMGASSEIGRETALRFAKRGAREYLVCGGQRSTPLESAYSASKHGVDGFLKSLRVELLREPKGFPPIYQPGVVADAILYSAEKAPREIVAGGAGKGMLITQRLSPRLMDAIMVRGGFGSQMTDEPKSTAAPDGLFAPMKGQDRAEGDFSEQALPRSYLTWLDTHPALKWGIGVAGAAVALGALRAKSGERR
jgi:hypothetical protein